MTATFSAGRFLVLDGGLGTTLEDLFQADLATPLWSANPVDRNPELVLQAHLSFLRAGANIISTSTYQCSFDTFLRAGYTADDAKRVMRTAVKLAAQARDMYLAEAPSAREIKIALSLGPYGATLTPAQEFDAFYPPPFGPQAYVPSGANRNAFATDADADARGALDALTAFHLERLAVFAEDADVWDAIDAVAFETVPLRREAVAIRRAVAVLQNRFPAKPWWVTAVFPSGQFPEEAQPGGRRVSVEEVARALYGTQDELGEKHGDDGALATPTGVGVNCTSIDVLPDILAQLSSAVADVCSAGKVPPPWLVVYPNGGQVYDVVKRTWLPPSAEHVGEGWARRLWDVLSPVVDGDGGWRGLLVGGCCKTGPTEISALAELVRAKARV